jgi:hypothetical protein
MRYLDSELLFGILILLAILVEANQESKAKHHHWPIKSGTTTNVIKVIKASVHPIMQNLRWTLIARYEPLVFDKVQAEMDNCKFTLEQEIFIWRWIRREIKFIQKN